MIGKMTWNRNFYTQFCHVNGNTTLKLFSKVIISMNLFGKISSNQRVIIY